MPNKEIQIPIRVINMPKIQIKKLRRRFSGYLPKIIYLVILGSMLIAGQSYMLSAYEAHVINVTARICRYSETRTIGFWKTHPEVYEPYLQSPPYDPLSLGPTRICFSLDDDPDNCDATADAIFQEADAVDMADMLKAQLLAMKFNIAHYGVGEYIVEGWGTIEYLVWLGDKALTENWDREDMEAVKDALNYVNNLHEVSHCLDIDPETQAPIFVIQGAPEPTEEIGGGITTFSQEPEVAGMMVVESLDEPASGSESFDEVVSTSESVDETTVSSSEEPQASEEEGGVIEEIVETIETAVEAVVETVIEPVVETVVEVVESLLGLEPTVEEPPVEEFPIEEPSVEPEPAPEPPAEEPSVEEPPAEEPVVEEPPTEEPPIEEPPVEEPPIEEPIIEE